MLTLTSMISSSLRRFVTPVLLSILFVLLILLTRPESFGDTPVYMSHIAGFERERSVEATRTLFEFGHLLWRPLGWLTWKVGSPILSAFYSDSGLQIAAALVSLNYIAGLASVSIVYAISQLLTKNTLRSALITLGFLCTNAFLNYVHSGTAYVPGLCLLLLGILIILRSVESGNLRSSRAWAAGCACALSVCFWLVYILALPGAMLLALLWNNPDSSVKVAWTRRLRFVAFLIAGTAVVGVGSYGAAALLGRIQSSDEALSWYSHASHGVKSNRAIIRIATGVPRSILNLGDDGLILKRFVLRDPFAPVSLQDILRLSVWKLVVVYSALLGLLFLCWKARTGNPILLCLAATILPVAFFAIVIFEPSQSERYMPAFGMLLVAVAFVAKDFHPKRWAHLLLAALLAAIFLVNVPALASSTSRRQFDPAVQRLTALRSVWQKNDAIIILSMRDGISRYYTRFLFEAAAQNKGMYLHDLIEGGTSRMDNWPGEVSNLIRRTWDHGGNVWISLRVYADKPEASWQWVEGDDPRVRWKDLPLFFSPLATDQKIGGGDGFVRLAQTPSNRVLIDKSADRPKVK